MAIKKPTKNESKESKVTYNIEVTRAKDLGEGKPIMFDMTVNGVIIYGCTYRVLSRKDGSGEFAKIGFPSYKGNNDTWYNHCYFKITDEMIDTIEKGIEAVL
ncbi:MAG: hypothetical protein J6Y78_00630 [Paludibacteraceae bacterium]|nr:hypothetical protein [Paludibacteraceae bacterium]